MTAQGWRQVKELLDRALDLGERERLEFLADLRRDDPQAAAEVEVLLALETEAGDFIEEPAFDIHGQDDPAVRVGQRLGPYELVQEVGAGGMGTVFLAVRADQEYDKTVAVKVLKRGLDTEEIVHRFRTERQILAGLVHPNIARLLDGGTTPDGRPYLVMDHVEGRPIDVYCHQEGLEVDARLDLFLIVCSAVQFAHRNLVVHRDLKPSNILVSDDGVPKLLDFGIARLLTPERAYTLPTAGVWRFLTPEYASPEQLTGAPITTATDVYSLGVLLYALLTDRRPYQMEDERSAAALARVLEHAEPPKPSSVAPAERAKRLRGDVDNIVLTTLRREPERRYGSVEALADDLRRHRDGLPVRATPDSLRYRVGKFVRRHRVGVAAATVILVLLVAFGVVTSVLLQRAQRERRIAQGVKTYLVDLFQGPDPTQGYDRDVRAREILDEGKRELLEEGKLSDQPEIRAELLYTLARTYLALGLDEEAGPLVEEAKRIRLDLEGEDAEALVGILSMEAEIAREVGQREKIEPLLREAIRIQRLHHGPRDPVIWTLYNNLATMLSDRGAYAEAERINLEILEERRRLYGRGSPDVATILNNLANNVKEQGRLADAERYYREALEIRRSNENVSKARVAATLNGFASFLESRGRPEEAEQYYREALRLYAEHYEKPTSRMASAQSNLAGLLTDRGQFAEAEELYESALNVLEDEQGKRGRVLSRLAILRLREGRAGDAEARAREAIGLLDSGLTPPWWIADARSILGTALAAQGHYAEAEPLLLDGYREILELRGADSDDTAAARRRIVELYEAWGRPQDAAAWRGDTPDPMDL